MRQNPVAFHRGGLSIPQIAENFALSDEATAARMVANPAYYASNPFSLSPASYPIGHAFSLAPATSATPSWSCP